MSPPALPSRTAWRRGREEAGYRTEHEERGRRDLSLQLATLAGRQEIMLKFAEMNQFGLLRAVDEVASTGCTTYRIPRTLSEPTADPSMLMTSQTMARS